MTPPTASRRGTRVYVRHNHYNIVFKTHVHIYKPIGIYKEKKEFGRMRLDIETDRLICTPS